MKVISLICLLLGGALQAKHQADIPFWSGQFKEHAEFCIDFTPNAQLKEHGRNLIRKFEDLQKEDPNVCKKRFINTAKEIKKFQKLVDKTITSKDPDASIKHDLIDHMNKETDYAIKRVERGRLSKKEEVKFWSEEHEGEAKATAYFMTTTNGLKTEAKQLEAQLKKNKSVQSLQVVEQANMKLDQASAELDAQPQKTRMPKKLEKHEARERQRAKEIFEELDEKN